ncbi:hypothetical protein [Stieleria maiorica]|nr:hypothetical protein [Stieleria maiorica]
MTLSKVKSVLESQGVPKGAELRYTRDGAEVVDEFGVTECVAV